MPSKRKTHLDAYTLLRSNRGNRGQKSPLAPVHDRRATELPKGVIPAVVDVRDPYDDVGGMITVIKNIRGDTLGELKARGQIDDAMYAAGLEWQRHYENAAIGALKAANPMKEPVDGGGVIADVLTDKQRIAVKRMAIADRDLGLLGRALVMDVLGRGLTIQAAAAERGATSEVDKKFWGKRFRECLQTLAVTYGYAMSERAFS